MAAETAEAAAANSTPLDHAMIASWSRNRDHRTSTKVYSLEDGNIREGHWLLNMGGEAVTIAFLWKNSSSGIYGLTTGHSFALDDPVFVFLQSEPTETTESLCYELKVIGTDSQS